MPNYFPGGVQIGPPGPQGPPGPSGADPLTTEGDMIYQAGGMAARLPIGIESDILAFLLQSSIDNASVSGNCVGDVTR